jgi:hypothetical protein
MTSVYPMSEHAFERNLTLLVPVLRRLAQVSDVLWWNQFSTVDNFGSSSGDKARIYSEKLRLYNAIAKRVLR